MAKRYLHEIDLMRAFVMLGVLSVHTTSFFNALNHDMTPSYLTFGALITSMHFTRESFMFVTGLVLFVTYYHSSFRVTQFWKKRFLLVAIPYIVWTIFYILFRGWLTPSYNWSFKGVALSVRHSLLTGDQYFLYFLVVSIQLYFFFPLLLRFLQKFERYHLQIFIASFLVQIGMMAVNKFVLNDIPPTAFPRVLMDLDKYRDRLVITYQFWFIAGGLMACHYQQIVAFIKRHRRALFVTLAATTVIVWGHYLVDRLVLHENEGLAELVLQPIMIPYSFIVTICLWYAGLAWTERRNRASWKSFSWFVETAANASFGIFLLQPFPLYYMEWSVNHLGRLGIPMWLHYSLWPVSIAFVYVSAMILSHWIGKVPVISYIVGRKVPLKLPTRPASRDEAEAT